MAKVGYARISTKGQKDDSQVDELETYGVDRLFIDKGVSGKHASRPELDKALAYLREGDVFVITRMSRAMRSLKHMLALAEELNERGIGLIVIKQNIDTTTPTGRLVFHILASIDEFQRELIVEGTLEGLAAAKARGHLGGRKPSYTANQASTARGLHAQGDLTASEIGAVIGVSRATVYRILKAALVMTSPDAMTVSFTANSTDIGGDDEPEVIGYCVGCDTERLFRPDQNEENGLLICSMCGYLMDGAVDYT